MNIIAKTLDSEKTKLFEEIKTNITETIKNKSEQELLINKMRETINLESEYNTCITLDTTTSIIIEPFIQELSSLKGNDLIDYMVHLCDIFELLDSEDFISDNPLVKDPDYKKLTTLLSDHMKKGSLTLNQLLNKTIFVGSELEYLMKFARNCPNDSRKDFFLELKEL